MPDFSFDSLQPLPRKDDGPLFQKKVLVLGAKGLSGTAIAQLLLLCGARVLLVDQSKASLQAFLQYAIEKKSALFCEQDKASQFLAEADLLVTAPGISPKHPLFESAKKKKIPIRGELDLAYEILMQLLPPKGIFVIAVTGTDGKSTVTALLCHLIKEATNQHALAAGNFGLPLSFVATSFLIQNNFIQKKRKNTKNQIEHKLLDGPPLNEYIDLLFSQEEQEKFQEIQNHSENLILVVENSSFQLELVESYHPQIALLLNLAEDHLDRYEGKMEFYLSAKLGLTKNMNKNDVLLCPQNLLQKIKRQATGPYRLRAIDLPLDTNIDKSERLPAILWEGNLLLPASKFSQPGRHNRLNLEFALAALAELQASLNSDPFLTKLKIDKNDLKKAIQNFQGLAHRLELVAESHLSFQKTVPAGIPAPPPLYQGISEASQIKKKSPVLRFVNDSKATTIHALLSALECYQDYQIFLLIGGRSKDTDFFPLKGLKKNVTFFAFGEAREELSRTLTLSQSYPNLETAFQAAFRQAMQFLCSPPAKKAVILLSPACASYDAYKNYLERGKHFRKLVQKSLERIPLASKCP